MRAKILRISVILIVMTLVFPINCKKSATAPEAEVWDLSIIWVDTFELAFTVSKFASNPAKQILQVKNIGVSTLSYNILDDADYYDFDWLTISPASGSSTGNLVEHEIIVDKTGMEARQEPYTAKITITSGDCYNSPQEIEVSMKVTSEPPPKMVVSPKNLAFSTEFGGPNPGAKEFTVQNTGGMVLEYEITADKNWIVVNPDTGSTGGTEKTHAVLIDAGGMAIGTYNGVITVKDIPTNIKQKINVTLTIRDKPPPEIGVDPDFIGFAAQVGEGNPANKKFSVQNTGEGTLRYEIDWDANWMTVSPTSGTSQGASRNHTVSVNTSGLAKGTYRGTIKVRDPEASNNPQEVRVSLDLREDAPPPPPSDENKIYLVQKKNSGGNGTNVTYEVWIDGNTSVISAFGLRLTFDDSVFDYVSFSSGSLIGWSDGNLVSPGVVNIGGYGGTQSIPVGSTGSIAKVTLKVNCGGCAGQKPSTCIGSFTDDIVGMVTGALCKTFTVT
ncbi:cohesin domain-containing protein [Acidobacteriota bacterium]